MGLNPSKVDEELVELMRLTGFKDVDLGAESGCDLTLRSLGKNFTKQDVLKAGRLLQAKKIPTSWYLLVGAPGETVQTLQETFDTIAAAAAPWDLVIIGVGIRVYKGSPMADNYDSKVMEDASDNFLHPVNYEPESIGLKTIRLLTKRAVYTHTNFLIFGEDIQFPGFVIRGVNIICKLLLHDAPIWQFYILARKILRAVGIDRVRKARFDRKHRELPALLQNEVGNHCTGSSKVGRMI
jgi:radical SAM superfamily enzyme YgiQ (UPF0313 family)